MKKRWLVTLEIKGPSDWTDDNLRAVGNEVIVQMDKNLSVLNRHVLEGAVLNVISMGEVQNAG